MGERFPDFTLPASDGSTVALAALRGRRLLVVCYRGGWCPFCVTELVQLRRHWQEIIDRRVDVLAVSVEPPEVAEALRRRIWVGIRFLSDECGALMDALRIRHQDALPPSFVTAEHSSRGSPDLFTATSFLVDEEGAIRWVYRPDTYRVRAPAREVLRAIDALG